MAWQKVNELPAALVAQMVTADNWPDNLRIVWKGKTPEDNIIFLATKETLVDMIQDTTQPEDMFELWGLESEIKDND